MTRSPPGDSSGGSSVALEEMDDLVSPVDWTATVSFSRQFYLSCLLILRIHTGH